MSLKNYIETRYGVGTQTSFTSFKRLSLKFSKRVCSLSSRSWFSVSSVFLSFVSLSFLILFLPLNNGGVITSENFGFNPIYVCASPYVMFFFYEHDGR